MPRSFFIFFMCSIKGTRLNLHELELQAKHKKYFDYTQFNLGYAQYLINQKKVLNIVEHVQDAISTTEIL